MADGFRSDAGVILHWALANFFHDVEHLALATSTAVIVPKAALS